MSYSRHWRLAALVLLLIGLVGLWHRRRRPQPAMAPVPAPETAGPTMTGAQVEALLALEAREREADRTFWAPELDAERHEDVFLDLWDALNQTNAPLAALARVPFDALRVGKTNRLEELQHGIRRITFADAIASANAINFTPSEWRAALATWCAEGWRLGRTTWHETRFVPATASGPARSWIEVSGHLTNALRATRIILRGRLEVEWKPQTDPAYPPVPRVITARQLERLERHGPPPFQETFTAEVSPAPGSFFVDPLLVSDLDGDGRSEIALVGANRLFRQSKGTWHSAPLAALPPGSVSAAVLADFDGDGRPDLLVAGENGLVLFANDGHGRFPGAGRVVWRAPQKLRHPQVITAGDIDGDGDLDLWLGQYKLPYQGGQFPTPYFDANDGFPSYLLRNDGAAGFTDITEQAGLAGKRWRRNYSASFVDLNGDGYLDLVTVNDFAGVDVYLNDGRGHFTDVTSRLGQTRHLFGMSHALADLNGDGWVDLFVLGMDAPTAARLDALGLSRPAFPQYASERAAMTYGNRLFLGGPGGLHQAPFAAQLARAGWSWSAALFDFDNDGDLDVAIANGQETRPSVKDYERQFWLHDIYVGRSRNDPVAKLYFGAATARRMAGLASYGGWQDNVFFMNLGHNQFAEVAFLLGLAVPADSQNLVTDDVDGDGRLDLVLTTFATWPDRREQLRIFRNATPEAGNWIGFRLDAATRPWAGARVRVHTRAGSQTRWLVTGDSFRSERAPTAHFGLGNLRSVIKAEILWPHGPPTTLLAPAINRWHQIRH